MKIDKVNSKQCWQKWSNENEPVSVYAMNHYDEMEDGDCGDEMRQMVTQSNDKNMKEKNISKQTTGKQVQIQEQYN